MTEALLIASESISVLAAPEALSITGGVLVLLKAKGASKLAERAPEPAEGLIDS